MSVMNGFREELVNRILGINGHLVVYTNNGQLIADYNEISKKVSDENNVGVFNQLMKHPELFHAAVVFAHMSKYGQTLDQREYTDYYREVINETSRYGTNDGVKEAINIYSPTRRILNFKPAQATELCYDQSLMSLGLRPD